MNGTESHREPVFAALFGSILAVGLPLNAVALWILIRRHSLKSPSSIFMVNLALSDLLLAISLPMRVYFYATGTWPLGSLACSLISVFFCNNIRSSSIFITFISIDRLLAVVYPLRSRHLRTSPNAWKAVSLCWLFVLVTSIPESLHLQNQLSVNLKHKSVCFELGHYLHTEIYAIVYFHVGLTFTMLAVNIVCTALVSWTLHRHLNESARVNNKVNVMLIFVMNLVMFIVCFLPVAIGLLLKPRFAITPLACLATANCCLDPLLYYFSLDAFWKKKHNVDHPGEQ